MQDNKYKILVVDDEEDLCEILKFNLETEGYVADTANSAEEAICMGVANYDLLLLDVMMGEMSGFTLARQMKGDEQTCHIPMIFLTAKDTENDMLTGFSIGADDYISKPFSTKEVMARVKAVIRRTAIAQQHEPQGLLEYQGLRLDLNRKSVCVDGIVTSFTKTEYELLHTLLEGRGRVFTRQELINKAWPSDVLVSDRTVDVNITRMRKKIGQYSKCIVTRQGYGYCFDE